MTERNTTTAAYQAAQAERRAAQTMDLRGQKLTLWIAVAAYIVYLIVPYAGSAHGWQVLSFGTTDGGVKISLMETVSAWLALLGVGVLTTATLLTRRATLGLIAWMMVTVSFFVNLWGFWYRGSTADAPAIGIAPSILPARRPAARSRAKPRFPPCHGRASPWNFIRPSGS